MKDNSMTFDRRDGESEYCGTVRLDIQAGRLSCGPPRQGGPECGGGGQFTNREN